MLKRRAARRATTAVLALGVLATGCSLIEGRQGAMPQGRSSPGPAGLNDWRACVSSWREQERYQQTITRGEFETLLETRFAPNGRLRRFLSFSDNSVTVYSSEAKTKPLWTLRFAETGRRRCFQAAFKTPDAVRLLNNSPQHPLRGLRIALDPGHIGGEYARMEERIFAPRRSDGGETAAVPIQEAVLNLTVAHLLKQKLEQAGATVLMVKDGFEPVTRHRPEDFRAQAEVEIDQLLGTRSHQAALFASLQPFPRAAYRADLVRKRMEWLFYRVAEIQARAELVNRHLRPDLTLCIHFNAKNAEEEGYGFVDDNRVVVFVHGNYLAPELGSDTGKLALFAKLLERSGETETCVADALGGALARARGLPPVERQPSDGSSGWLRVGANPYVYARNLLANRLYSGPVVYLEPYYQNNPVVYERILAGDYEGERLVAGRWMKSIFREYADAVAEGILEVYGPCGLAPEFKEFCRTSTATITR